VTEIEKDAFAECTSLETVDFGGTVAEWKEVIKDSGWNENVPAKDVRCSNGYANL
jgi:hypothetical protein